MRMFLLGQCSDQRVEGAVFFMEDDTPTLLEAELAHQSGVTPGILLSSNLVRLYENGARSTRTFLLKEMKKPLEE